MAVGDEIIARVPLQVVGDAEAEFADDEGPVPAAVVVAGFLKVGGGGFASASVVDAVVVRVFEVTMVVVGGVVEIREVLFGVAGAPFLVLRVFLALDVFRIREYFGKRTIIWMWTNLSLDIPRLDSAARMRFHAVG